MTTRHRDAFGRISLVDQEVVGQEHYLRPRDGRLRRLKVQGTDDAKGLGRATWERNGRLQSRIPMLLRLARWTYSSVLIEGTEERHYDGTATFILLLKWIPSCLLLVILVSF